MTLPEGVWDVYINGEKAGTEVLETISNGTATVAPISAMVLVKGDGAAVTEGTAAAKPMNKGLVAVGVVAVVAVAAGVIIFVKKKKK